MKGISVGRFAVTLGVLGLVVFLGTTRAAPASAQPIPQQTGTTYDGTAFSDQSLSTQNDFIAAYGANAANVWAQQHNAALAAAGYPVPQSAVAVITVPEVILDNNNYNDNNDNIDINDNGNHHHNVNNDNGNHDHNAWDHHWNHQPQHP
jgi:hypothetical protein